MSLQNHLLCSDSTPGFLGMFDFSIAPQLLFYSYIPIVIASLLLSIVILTKNKNSLQARLFAVISSFFSLWVLAAIFNWVAVHASVVHFSWELLAVVEFAIYLSALYFVTVYLEGRDISFTYKLVGIVFFLPAIVLMSTSINMSSFDPINCQATNGPIWFYIYAFEILSIVLMIVLSIKKYYSLHSDSPLRKQIPLLSTGMVLFLGIFTTTNILGDTTQTYEFNLIGPIGMLMFLVLLTYIIVRFNAFNIKLAGAQALVLGLLSLVGALVFVVKSPTSQAVAAATFVFTAVAGFFLVRSVKKEIKQREEIEKLAANLEHANERLKELDKMKSEFVSIASHQLRSPLTSIRGYTSMLSEGSYGPLPPKAKEAIDRIAESSRLMALSIEDYLNVSRIQSGNMKYELSDFNLKDMVSKLVDDKRREAMKKGLLLTFKNELHTSKGITHADVGKTTQIIHNLIDNAMKYTPKGKIEVVAVEDVKQKHIIINISDTGIGMTEETRVSLFEKFKRAETANSVNVTGTGLGLYIARKMAQDMDGDITVSSPGTGLGSTFALILPLHL